MSNSPKCPIMAAVMAFTCICASAVAGDQPQWGQRHTRNMVSDETGLPESFDPESGRNVKWSVDLGGPSRATPVIAQGKVFVGTNNSVPQDPRHKGIRGVLLCLDEETGEFQWQLTVPKFEGDEYLDWHLGGICSPPTVEGDRVYVVSNRAEVLCLDINGQTNGNDGPFRDEGRHMVSSADEPMEVTDKDADIIWSFDMPKELHVHHHDAAHSSILIHGQYLYLNTGNGVDKKHSGIPEPDAPSLIVIDKATGRLVARDDEHIGPRIFHCTWSSPAFAVVNDVPLVFFCGGDGVCYAFKALEPTSDTRPVRMLQRIWRFDCDPDSPKEDVHRFVGNRQDSPSNVKSMPVFQNNRLFVTFGGDIWWGKNQAGLKCLDVTGTGDITQSGLRWSYDLERHCCATPTVYDEMVFVGDLGRVFHCVDANTGQSLWRHSTKGEIWSTALVADGKVYIGNRRGEFFVFAASPQKSLLSKVDLDGPICATPVAANGKLYVATLGRLFALQEGIAGGEDDKE